MRVNESTCLVGRTVKLVPYCREHVGRYHQWMEDEWLREMTCSERLSLEEEYENQVSWRESDNKLTFIVLDRTLPGEPMAGDVNVFLLDEEDGEVEIEIMIAEEQSRRKGLATEATKLMMQYSQKTIGVKRFVAKIGEKNDPSIQLFKSLGFQTLRVLAVFQEVHLSADVTEELRTEWDGQLTYVSTEEYHSTA